MNELTDKRLPEVFLKFFWRSFFSFVFFFCVFSFVFFLLLEITHHDERDEQSYPVRGGGSSCATLSFNLSLFWFFGCLWGSPRKSIHQPTKKEQEKQEEQESPPSWRGCCWVGHCSVEHCWTWRTLWTWRPSNPCLLSFTFHFHSQSLARQRFLTLYFQSEAQKSSPVEKRATREVAQVAQVAQVEPEREFAKETVTLKEPSSSGEKRAESPLFNNVSTLYSDEVWSQEALFSPMNWIIFCEQSGTRLEFEVPDEFHHLIIGKGGSVIKGWFFPSFPIFCFSFFFSFSIDIQGKTKTTINLPEKGGPSNVVVQGLLLLLVNRKEKV